MGSGSGGRAWSWTWTIDGWMGVLDMDTLRAVSQKERSCKDAEQIKRRALEFINMMENGANHMEPGRLKAMEENEQGEEVLWREDREGDKV